MKSVVIIEGSTGHALVFSYFAAYGCFLASNFLHPKGNHPSKFQLIRFSIFGGVRKQTNTQTHSLTSYCFNFWIFVESFNPNIEKFITTQRNWYA